MDNGALRLLGDDAHCSPCDGSGASARSSCLQLRGHPAPRRSSKLAHPPTTNSPQRPEPAAVRESSPGASPECPRSTALLEPRPSMVEPALGLVEACPKLVQHALAFAEPNPNLAQATREEFGPTQTEVRQTRRHGQSWLLPHEVSGRLYIHRTSSPKVAETRPQLWSRPKQEALVVTSPSFGRNKATWAPALPNTERSWPREFGSVSAELSERGLDLAGISPHSAEISQNWSQICPNKAQNWYLAEKLPKFGRNRPKLVEHGATLIELSKNSGRSSEIRSNLAPEFGRAQPKFVVLALICLSLFVSLRVLQGLVPCCKVRTPSSRKYGW